MLKIISRPLSKIFKKLGYTITPTYFMIPPVNDKRWIDKLDIHTIIDIGSNEGQFIQKITSLLPGRKIYAFEPVLSCYNALVEQTAKENITTFNIGLSDRDGISEINISNNLASSSLLNMEELHLSSYPGSVFVKKEKIQLKRLDDVLQDESLKKNILIKLDVQGYEEKVIAGGKVTFAKASLLLIETIFQPLYEGQWLFDDIYRYFTAEGFIFMGFAEQEHSPQSGIPLFADAIFIKKEFIKKIG